MSNEYWQRFVQTGSVNDYLEYKKHNEEIKAEGNEVYFKSNDGEERWTEYEHYENGVISKMIEYSRF